MRPIPLGFIRIFDIPPFVNPLIERMQNISTFDARPRTPPASLGQPIQGIGQGGTQTPDPGIARLQPMRLAQRRQRPTTDDMLHQNPMGHRGAIAGHAHRTGAHQAPGTAQHATSSVITD